MMSVSARSDCESHASIGADKDDYGAFKRPNEDLNLLGIYLSNVAY